MRPASEDGAISRLRPEELGIAQQARTNPDDLIALTLQMQPDSRPGRGGIEVAAMPGAGRVFILPFVALLPEPMCHYSTLTDASGSPMRAPTQGMLPVTVARLVIPRRNLTGYGWDAVARSEAFDALNQLAGWMLSGEWEDGPLDEEEQVLAFALRWKRTQEDRSGPLAALVFASDDQAVALVLTPAGAMFSLRAFVAEPLPARHARAWAQDAAAAYLASAQAEAAERARAFGGAG